MDSTREREDGPLKLFDVTCIIGSVYRDDSTGYTPQQAAMLLIGEHEAEGCYTFPHFDGRTISVTVEYQHPPENPSKRKAAA